MLLYPDWSNASDWKQTKESLGTVALHNDELAEAIENLVLVNDFDEHKMALKWCERVDGDTIFPKLPVHLRTYYEKWERNERIREAVDKAKSATDKLKELNEALCPSEKGVYHQSVAATDTQDADTQPGQLLGEQQHRSMQLAPIWPAVPFPVTMQMLLQTRNDMQSKLSSKGPTDDRWAMGGHQMGEQRMGRHRAGKEAMDRHWALGRRAFDKSTLGTGRVGNGWVSVWRVGRQWLGWK